MNNKTNRRQKDQVQHFEVVLVGVEYILQQDLETVFLEIIGESNCLWNVCGDPRVDFCGPNSMASFCRLQRAASTSYSASRRRARHRPSSA